ncbi:hypothetical protein FGG08_003748 [Glutinoglossum americanum]|uniref:AAA+ ATPase domain-containing protein n=1 Tax=Glutinoglossum americanum TaxID=1670608 RepID=A0A9P8L4H6_9PEZI|nr:hypothetical protein FGG08_003748 [Glutinoglossum americanum]
MIGFTIGAFSRKAGNQVGSKIKFIAKYGWSIGSGFQIASSARNLAFATSYLFLLLMDIFPVPSFSLTPPGLAEEELGPASSEHAEVARAEGQTVDILYNVTCRDVQLNRAKAYTFLENPFHELDLHGLKDEQQTPIIEIFIKVEGEGSTPDWSLYYPGGDFDSDSDSDSMPGIYGARPRSRSKNRGRRDNIKTSLPVEFGGFQASSMNVQKIHIHSDHLKKLLRDLVTYYPGQTFTDDFIPVYSPFKMLAHYYHKLMSLSEKARNSPEGDSCKETSGPETAMVHGRAATHDLKVLLDYMTPRYLRTIKPWKERHDAGVATYESLWFLFEPGSEAYSKVDGKLAGFTIDYTNTIKDRGPTGNIIEEWFQIGCWNLVCDGRLIVRSPMRFKIKKFEGERAITSFEVFPTRFLDSNNETRSKLIEGGKKCYKITRKLPAHMAYQGRAWGQGSARDRGMADPSSRDGKPKLHYEGDIVIDPLAYLIHSMTTVERQDPDYYLEPPMYREQQPTLLLEEDPRCLDFQNIDPKTREALTESHYFLFPSRINGFALKQKRWMGFDIEDIRELKWTSEHDSAMSRLILPPRDIDLIKAIALKHSEENKGFWSADFIPGKGEGQIFLLHGPPGTGKTYTVAKTDIGTNEERMEANLSRWFTIAASWDAILLIDEADVFLERRQVADLQRNSLISVALTYEPLDAATQKYIWEGFLAKLGRERMDVIVTDRARDFLWTDDDMKIVSWNGRDIRNAKHDAERDAKRYGKQVTKIEVDKDHFVKVVMRRKAFTDYKNKIRGQTEEQRAFSEGSRAITKQTAK